MSEPKTFGQLATFTPIFDEVVVHFTEHPLMGRKHGDKRRKKFTISPLIVASVYGRVWRRCDNGAPDGRCWMGTRRIGKDLGISYRQAARALVALVEANYLIYCGVKETTGSNIYRIPQMADLVEVGHSATGVGHCDPGVGHSETEETSKDTSKETQRVVVVGLEKIGITNKDAKKLISRYGIDTITETQEALQEARETGFKAGNPAGVLVWALEHGGPKGVKKIVKSEKAVPSYSGEGFEDFWDA